MKLGYARVSTDDQDLGRQITALEKVGCEKIYREYVSGGKRSSEDRPELYKMLEEAKEGDIIYVQKIDRLSRSMVHFLTLVEQFLSRGLVLRDTENTIDMSTAHGRMMMNMLSCFAEFELEFIRERTKDGLKQARANGSVLGRPNKTLNKVDEIKELLADGIGITAISRRLMISRPTVYRALNKS